MTAFNRAVEALKRLFPDATDAELAGGVRKVLEAVREPDEAMQVAAVNAIPHSEFGFADAITTQAWPAMIDAIIIQDPSIPVVGRPVMDSDGPHTKQLREEADRQYPTGEEG